MLPKSDRNTFSLLLKFSKDGSRFVAKLFCIMTPSLFPISSSSVSSSVYSRSAETFSAIRFLPDFWNHPVNDVTAAVISRRCEWLFYFHCCFKVSSTACSVWWNASVTLDVSFSACCHGDCRLLSRMAGMKEQQFTEEKPLLPEQRGVDSDMVSRPVYFTVRSLCCR